MGAGAVTPPSDFQKFSLDDTWMFVIVIELSFATDVAR